MDDLYYRGGPDVAFTHPLTDSGSTIIIYNGTLHVPQWWTPRTSYHEPNVVYSHREANTVYTYIHV